MVRDELRCGNCGKDLFRLTYLKSGSDDSRFGGDPLIRGKLEITCQTCHHFTVIGPGRPCMEEDRSGSADNDLCGGWQ